ncbi:protein PHYTOCHROME KINASE SUBSTRATE 1-like [Gastrolobium bilobum]|uniref:protein PHYTOCHROME KINASE SUBSTRATE 1-like n=1 Tax=Gastrolobium bilobum TaxID=150636 RepID=UPI002AB16ED8|nr:protein PHYTOCHROME KINASE SUBSTRATE 1-like [Gastrolobium bilobum]
MVVLTTTANSSLHQLQTFNAQNNNHHLRDASFSSYLNSNEDTLAESSQNLNPFIRNKKDPLHQGAKKEEDGEIGVFEAEKYFNGGEMESQRVANVDANKNQYQKEQTTAETRRYKVQYGTPSVRSESSWNSQSALLQSVMRNSSRNRKDKVQRKSFLAGLGCKCYCSDKNSVDICDHAEEISFNKTSTYGVVHGKKSPKKLFNADLDANHSIKIDKPHAELLINKDVNFQKPEKLDMELNRENDLSFSTLNSRSGNQMVKMQLEEVENPRKSLEVFGSPIMDGRSKSLSFDKRLIMPSWDAAAPKMEEIDLSANSGGNFNDDGSDASSDLFEIESLTGKSNPFLARTTSNVASGCASPTTCYAPSEASIEWSVVTASAVEYSAMSDYEDQRPVATIRSPIRTSLTSSNAKPKVSKEIHRRRPSILLGCKSQKAVGVAVDAFTTHEKPRSNPQIRHKSDTFPHVTRFHSETKEGNFGARHGQHAYATPPLQRSHSPNSSQLLYI